MMQESMSGSTKTFAKSVLDKKTGFSKNSVKKESPAEPALHTPETNNTDNQKSEKLQMAENPSFSKSENILSSQLSVNRNEGVTLTSGGSMSGFYDKEGSGSFVAKGSNSGNDIVESEFGSIGGPSFLKMVKPEYPRLARRLGKEGKVVLRLLIDEHGKLVSVELIEKAGYGFDEAAIEAVKASAFRPARVNGLPVACRAVLPVRFRLE
jgi:TonB family protein